MQTVHDPPSGQVDEASGTDVASLLGTHDPLSDVLRTIKLKGALFFMVDATSPWCIEVPHTNEFADIILPEARHVVSYHVAVEGHGLAVVPGAEPIPFAEGDIIVIAGGDPYTMMSGPGVTPEFTPEEILQFFRDCADRKLPFVIPEGGGNPPGAKFICGFLGCDFAPFNPLIGALPSILNIRRRETHDADLLDQLVSLAMAEVKTPRTGGETVRLGLSELMFVEVLRRHLQALPPDEQGWLAGLRDPKVGRALMHLHADPARNWTLDDLAREAGASRSVLAERFLQFVGETPMRYLQLWRIQLAARLLADGSAKVASIAEEVGFAAEASFSRTFKKVTGLTPSAWRRSA